MILAVIQARMSSNRLPGKVLLPIAGKPMLQHVIDATEKSALVDHAIVATSEEASDDPICKYLEERYNQSPGHGYYRGSLDDVLGRFYQTASGAYLHPTYIVRLTADCPLLTGDIIDATIKAHLEGNNHYTVNEVDGVDVEVFSYDTLLRAHKLATSKFDREHVTPWIKARCIPNVIHCGVDVGSVDTRQEYEMIKDFIEAREGVRNGN